MTSVAWEISTDNRWAREIYFDVCLKCRALDRCNCTCHDEGKGQN